MPAASQLPAANFLLQLCAIPKESQLFAFLLVIDHQPDEKFISDPT